MRGGVLQGTIHAESAKVEQQYAGTGAGRSGYRLEIKLSRRDGHLGPDGIVRDWRAFDTFGNDVDPDLLFIRFGPVLPDDCIEALNPNEANEEGHIRQLERKPLGELAHLLHLNDFLSREFILEVVNQGAVSATKPNAIRNVPDLLRRQPIPFRGPFFEAG